MPKKQALLRNNWKQEWKVEHKLKCLWKALRQMKTPLDWEYKYMKKKKVVMGKEVSNKQLTMSAVIAIVRRPLSIQQSCHTARHNWLFLLYRCPEHLLRNLLFPQCSSVEKGPQLLGTVWPMKSPFSNIVGLSNLRPCYFMFRKSSSF